MAWECKKFGEDVEESEHDDYKILKYYYYIADLSENPTKDRQTVWEVLLGNVRKIQNYSAEKCFEVVKKNADERLEFEYEILDERVRFYKQFCVIP